MTAIANDGTVYTWGYNGHGELGNGGTTASLTPIQVPNLSDVKDIATGYYHIVVLKEDGTVWAWGINADYKKTVPTQVKLDAENDLTDIIDIGANYATSYALTSKRKSICMGTK